MEYKLRQSGNIPPIQYFQFPLKDTCQLHRNWSLQKSFISTSKSRDNSLNKSIEQFKIKALPHHNQASLSSKQNFVLVFQAIEIERLSQQIEIQQKKLRDFERQTNNVENYEVQIKQLSDRILILQQQLEQYKEQLDKVNRICEKLQVQNQLLKGKTQPNMLPIRMIDNESEDPTIKTLNRYILTIDAKNKKLLKTVDQKSNQIDKLQKMTMRSTKDSANNVGEKKKFFHFHKTNIANKNEEISHKTKINKLSQQIYRLSQIMLEKNNQIWNLENQLAAMKQERKDCKPRTDSQNKREQANYCSRQSQMSGKIIKMKTQYQECKVKLRKKEEECEEYRRNQKQIFKDLKDIDKLRIICENQQNQILENLKDLNKLKISNMIYQTQLSKDQNYNKMRENRFIQSIYSYMEGMHCADKNKDRLEDVLSKIIYRIKELETISQNLSINYNNLLKRVGENESNIFQFSIAESKLSN